MKSNKTVGKVSIAPTFVHWEQSWQRNEGAPFRAKYKSRNRRI